MTVLAASPLRIAAALALVASLAASADAQPRNRRPSFPAGLAEARLVKERAEAIGVGEETLEKLEKLVAETREKEEALRARTVEAENQVRTLLDENLPEEKALLKAGEVGSDVARETRQLRLQTSLRVRALLTKEQLEKFMELRKNAIGKRRRTGGRPGRRPPEKQDLGDEKGAGAP
jgi:Spy/CpxP family protein refolding chaperone